MSRFTFHKPAAQLAGTAPALVEVRDEGQPIGLLNRHRDGYILRDLDGKKVETTYGISRATAAGVLAQTMEAAYRVASGTWDQGQADEYLGKQRQADCDGCGQVHEAVYSHEGRFSEGPIYAVACFEDGLTSYVTTEGLVAH
jgi:hypothetical protein